MTHIKRIICLLVVLLLFFVVAVILVRPISHMAWLASTPTKVKAVAAYVEDYKMENGRYPRALSDLASLEIDNKKVWPLSESNGEQYNYRVFSNGFSISITKAASLFSQYETVSNYFEAKMENRASKSKGERFRFDSKQGAETN